MTITVGEKLPEATLLKTGAKGPEPVDLGAMTSGKKVVIFGLPGAFTSTCSTAHVPSFIRSMEALKAKGVDTVACVSVNDPFVMSAWSEATGAGVAGIEMLADAEGTLTKALGLDFSAPPVGLIGRSKRYALMAEDGVVKVLNAEENPGVCDTSGGEAMVDAL